MTYLVLGYCLTSAVFLVWLYSPMRAKMWAKRNPRKLSAAEQRLLDVLDAHDKEKEEWEKRDNDPQLVALIRDWEAACWDAYAATGELEPTATLPVNLLPFIASLVSPLTGRPVAVSRSVTLTAPLFEWPKVRAWLGMVVDA